MTENVKDNEIPEKSAKKKSLFEKILDRIRYAIFVLFIAALIVLRAPWPVVAVFISIILVDTIIPKHIRKRIWLAIWIVIAVFIVWIFLPDDMEG